MIRRWGPVLMAAAGLTLAVSTPAAAAHRPKRANQTITFVRTPGVSTETIRATARGPVVGFGTAHVLDFTPDPSAGRFRGTWELRFPHGTIRYRFTGSATTPPQQPGPRALPAGRLALPADDHPVRPGGLAVPAADLVTHDPARTVVRGDFELLAGTGRFATLAGQGTFHGFTLPTPPPLPNHTTD
ncbi:hypothetical protein [Actinocatenispora rupis]|uniref:Htaa protein n=1 Tax=Actinocatenispora rupis TaxID=519421 RepID=A0A8J3JDN0_9ACTN|nr:hypothetical protein [Actinocatenispora rupis]GID14799.1 hypothetical protein Aru02nite_56880 [Actinocatenispora rupis]